jgi:hypothetical protein
MRRLLLVWLLISAAPALAGAQAIVDSTRRIVAGRPILDSDIRIARELKLVAPSATTDEQILTELENRMLVLTEIGRVTTLTEPTADDVSARRQRWASGLGADPASRLAAVHMSEAELMTWLRDDLRIQKYEQQRFGREADPARAMGDWIVNLRKRAGLK